jgi:hypothetical protein
VSVVRYLLKKGILAVAMAGVLVGFVGVVPAFALSPWWHLSTSSSSTYLQRGQEADEAWQLTVSATSGTYRVNYVGEELLFEVGEAPAQLQVTLEGVFGAGNVQVTGGPGPEHNNPYEVYEIKFVGKLAYRHLDFADTQKELVTNKQAGNEETLIGGRKRAELGEVAEGRPAGVILVTAVNLGNANVNPGAQPATLTDKLPAGLEAVWIEGYAAEGVNKEDSPLECSLGSLSCTFTGINDEPNELRPYEQMQMRIAVNKIEAKSGAVNEASVVGGGAPAASARRSLTVSGSPSPFGVSVYEMRPEEEGGGVATQAGSHPFQLTTTLAFNEKLAFHNEGRAFKGLGGGVRAEPVALAKDLHFRLPPGLIGNPTPFAQCPLGTFLHEEGRECPQQSVVGVARVTIAVPGILAGQVVPISEVLYNLDPAVGEPARFAFEVYGTPVMLDTAVRTGGDYGVTVNVTNITQVVGFLGSEVTFWGVPGDPRHDHQRGYGCLSGLGSCSPLGAVNPPPLLELPTSCTGPLSTTLGFDSWKEPSVVGSLPNTAPMPAVDGCNRLQFEPSISLAPDGQAGSTPTGLSVKVSVPQAVSLDAEGLAEADVKNTTVTLPAGVTINPAGADGLEACSEEQIALKSPEPPTCPNASKVGLVKIHTPLLPNPLEGAAYLAAQNANPFGSLVALYVFVEDPISGSRVKLAGEVVPDPVTGQLVSTFKNTPQLPFETFELHFFGGDRAPLATPALCGSYTTTASIEPWTETGEVGSNSTFDVVSGPNGSPCRNPLAFDPSLTAGSLNIQAGAFTPFTNTMSRQDGDQNLQGIVLHMPPGLFGLLTGVKLCGETEANSGSCGPESLIGETVVSVGLGGDPFSVKGGKVYLTGPYKGAPFGLSIVNPAKAGPYDLGQVVVRAKIETNPTTAAITVTTDDTGPYRIPTIIDGIPLQIKHVYVNINRPGFTFNPTNCNPMAITGSLQSTEGASQAVSVPFQVTNCATLAFKPGFAVSTSGKTSRANGASLSVKLTYPKAPFGSQANIKSVKVDLPKQLPSRLTTLQKACTAAQFDANPAGCPPASMVGHANAITPLIPVPLAGPAYFVSYGGAKFPELVIVLQGYGVTIDLHGETFINKAGITSSTFKTVPDAPVGSFELTLPQGKFSALAANGNLCKSKLAMPTAFTAQNGMTIHQSTPISVTGCAKAKKAKAKRASHRRKKGK